MCSWRPDTRRYTRICSRKLGESRGGLHQAPLCVTYCTAIEVYFSCQVKRVMTWAVDKHTEGKSMDVNKQVNSKLICMYCGIHMWQQVGCWQGSRSSCRLWQVCGLTWQDADSSVMAVLAWSCTFSCVAHPVMVVEPLNCVYIPMSESRAQWCWSDGLCQFLSMYPDRLETAAFLGWLLSGPYRQVLTKVACVSMPYLLLYNSEI